jgi:hypothetical protein
MQKKRHPENMMLNCGRMNLKYRNTKARRRTLVRKDVKEHRQPGYPARVDMVNETPKTRLTW